MSLDPVLHSFRYALDFLREQALTPVRVGHTSHHVGQVGVSRKAMRLPPMQRGFE